MINPKVDLESQIRYSYELIYEHEKIIQATDRPEEKMRSRRRIEEQKKLIVEYLSRYISLCQQLKTEMAQGIIEIANLANVPLPQKEETGNRVPHRPNKRRKTKIFISYARSDLIVAGEIYVFLRDNGFIPWMDKYDLLPGQDWKLEIHKNIGKSDYFIACLSNHSVSKVGYVQKELKEALAILDEMPEGQIYLIPIKIDDCIVPVSLEERHWLDWLALNAKELLLQAVRTK